jgi:hypothetical protein
VPVLLRNSKDQKVRKQKVRKGGKILLGLPISNEKCASKVQPIQMKNVPVKSGPFQMKNGLVKFSPFHMENVLIKSSPFQMKNVRSNEKCANKVQLRRMKNVET